jgi:hypothetical protein
MKLPSVFRLLAWLPIAVSAGLPLPDHILYGTISQKNLAVTRQRTDVTVEARRSLNGPVLASYRMGTVARLGEFFYELRIPLQESPRSSPAAAEPGETLFLLVKDASGELYRTTHRLTEPGVALRLDFGISVDTEGDGVPDGWEQSFLGGLSANLQADTDGDGASDGDEYLAGTHPRHAEDVFRLAVQTPEPGKIRVSFRALSPLGPGYEGRRRIYAVESRTNLVEGSWQPIANLSRIPGANQWVEFEQSDDDTQPPYFRARVWLEGP